MNYESSTDNPGHAQRYINGEVAAMRLKHFPSNAQVHWSLIGLVPKDHQPGKFQLIIDLSFPMDASINDGINFNLTSLTYPGVDNAVADKFSRLWCPNGEAGSFCSLQTRPDYQALLTIRWGWAMYLDTALPFVLCSAPKIFTAMADGLSWCMLCEGVSHFIHYLDDFCSPPQSSTCGQSLQVAIRLCESTWDSQ